MYTNEVLSVNSQEEFNELKKYNANILVCFSASWCPPCRAMEGTILNAAFELNGIATVVKVDPKSLPEIAQMYEVKTIPAFVSIVDSEVQAKVTGIQPIDILTYSFL